MYTQKRQCVYSHPVPMWEAFRDGKGHGDNFGNIGMWNIKYRTYLNATCQFNPKKCCAAIQMLSLRIGTLTKNVEKDEKVYSFQENCLLVIWCSLFGCHGDAARGRVRHISFLMYFDYVLRVWWRSWGDSLLPVTS